MSFLCFFGHSSDWTRVLVEGVWHRQCIRCQQPTTPLLVNDEGTAITPAKVPPIVQRHAEKQQKVKVKRAVRVLKLARKQA